MMIDYKTLKKAKDKDFLLQLQFNKYDTALCRCDNPIKGKVVSPVYYASECVGDWACLCKCCGKYISIN